MKPRPYLLSVLLLPVLAACSGDGDALTGGDPTAAGDASSSTSSSADSWCPGRWEILPATAVPERSPGVTTACIDSASPLTLDVCITHTPMLSGFRCFTRRGTSEKVWLYAVEYEVFPPPAEWQACPDGTALPRPCFVSACESDFVPVSTCSEEQTRLKFRCGEPDDKYDEACCHRPSCFDAECPEGLVCRTVGTIAVLECGAGATPDECLCGGTPGGANEDLCFPG